MLTQTDLQTYKSYPFASDIRFARQCSNFYFYSISSSASSSNGQSGGVAADGEDNTWYSIFPVENEELVYGTWEEEVIWDAENMPVVPKPKILTLDPNDENIILGIPDDVDPSKITRGEGIIVLWPYFFYNVSI